MTTGFPIEQVSIFAWLVSTQQTCKQLAVCWAAPCWAVEPPTTPVRLWATKWFKGSLPINPEDPSGFYLSTAVDILMAMGPRVIWPFDLPPETEGAVQARVVCHLKAIDAFCKRNPSNFLQLQHVRNPVKYGQRSPSTQHVATRSAFRVHRSTYPLPTTPGTTCSWDISSYSAGPGSETISVATPTWTSFRHGDPWAIDSYSSYCCCWLLLMNGLNEDILAVNDSQAI